MKFKFISCSLLMLFTANVQAIEGGIVYSPNDTLPKMNNSIVLGEKVIVDLNISSSIENSNFSNEILNNTPSIVDGGDNTEVVGGAKKIEVPQKLDNLSVQVMQITYFESIQNKLKTVETHDDLDKVLSDVDKSKLTPEQHSYIEYFISTFVPKDIGQRDSNGIKNIRSVNSVILSK